MHIFIYLLLLSFLLLFFSFFLFNSIKNFNLMANKQVAIYDDDLYLHTHFFFLISVLLLLLLLLWVIVCLWWCTGRPCGYHTINKLIIKLLLCHSCNGNNYNNYDNNNVYLCLQRHCLNQIRLFIFVHGVFLWWPS